MRASPVFCTACTDYQPRQPLFIQRLKAMPCVEPAGIGILEMHDSVDASNVARKPHERRILDQQLCRVSPAVDQRSRCDRRTLTSITGTVSDGGKPFAFAGLWEWWREPGKDDAPALESCCLLTGEPNELQGKIHDRMPMILDLAHYDAWLDPANEDRERLLKILLPFDSKRMTVRPVSTYVNNARNEGEQCTASAGSAE
jgi:hypothetical protein